MTTLPSRGALRRRLREARRELAPETRKQLEAAVTGVILKSPWFRRAQHIGMYLAFDGELDLDPVIGAAQRMGKSVYLPKLGRHMRFATLSTGFAINAYGIREPRATARPPGELELDLVLVPLVGFDASGARLGMGGGHYDRYFRRRLRRRIWRRPKLLGVGFELQRIETLDRATWDVPLDAIVTERGIAPAQRKRNP